jgi:hypothetical protein
VFLPPDPQHAPLIVDTQNAFKGLPSDNVLKA